MKNNILLIDDDEDELLIFKEALSQIEVPFNCSYAQNGDTAMSMLDHICPDFIFIDVNMPRQNGLSCLAQIKKLKKCKDASVFLYSTGLTDETCKNALELGATSCIKKPSNILSLTQVLKQVFHV